MPGFVGLRDSDTEVIPAPTGRRGRQLQFLPNAANRAAAESDETVWQTGTHAERLFLEKLLDDRSQDVRRTAADVLARLAESRLVQCVIERASALLTFEPGKLLHKDRLHVTLPENCDEMMRRDGIVPPGYWSQAWRKNAVEIIRASPIPLGPEPQLPPADPRVHGTAKMSKFG